MLKIYDRNKVPKKALEEYFDYHIEHVLDLDDKTLYFTSFLKDVKDVVEIEGYIETKDDIFVISEITESTDGNTVDVVAKLDMEALEGKAFKSFKTTEQTIEAALQLAFAGTGWTIKESNVTKKRTISMTNSSALQILSQALKTYRAEIKIDSINHTVSIFETVGSDKGAYFSSQLNLKKLDVQTTSADFYTEIEPYGKDGLTIETVNDGKIYLENHQYSDKVKRYIWKDERYTIPESLKEDAEAKLSDMSKPYVSYTVDILELSHAYPFLAFEIGDIVTIIDSTTGTKEQQRIVKIDRYPDEPVNDQCTLANKTLTFDEQIQKYESTSNTVDNITNDNGQVDGDTIDGIYSEQVIDLENAIVTSATIVNLTSQYLEVTGKLTAVEADIGSLNANVANLDQAIIGKLDADTAEITYAKIEDLEATNATIGTLETEYLNVSERLTALNANISNLQADYANIQEALVGKLDAEFAEITYATITELNAAKADIGVLEADSANIKSLLAGNAGVGDLQNIHLTSANAVIDNALIRNAVIQTVSVGDLLAGTISTNKFTIASDDGSIRISGATQQWKDENGVVRVQIGKDAQGDFTFSLFDETGTGVLIDSTGIKAGAIADGLIVNDMVADDAAIAGSKLDIESVFTEMNGSSSVLNSSRIWFDEKNQSLTQVYDQMSSDIENSASIAQGAMEDVQNIQNDVTLIQTGMDGIRADISSMQTEISGIANGALLFNVQYTDNENGTVTLNAKVYKEGKDVTTTFNSYWFSWWAKSETGNQFVGYGYSITVDKDDVGFGSTYIGRFTTYEDRYLTTRTGAYLTTRSGNRLVVRVEN